VDRYPDGLTYSMPADLADLAPGERVVVPLGRGNHTTTGYVIDVADETDLDPQKIKSIDRRDKSGVTLPTHLMALAQWISGYYGAPIGITLANMLPAAVKRGVGAKARIFVDLNNDADINAVHSPKQRAVVEALQQLPVNQRPMDQRELRDLTGLKTLGPIKRLLEADVLCATHRTVVEATWAKHMLEDHRPDHLTDAQQQTVDAIANGLDRGFSTHLLFGVTGSGKTEVYLRLIERVIESGRTAILLVPEISLTPQTGGRLLGRFPDQRIAILHSGLTAAQRHQHWRMAAEGHADIVIGARSAVFAPVDDQRLGLIIVDEEHDGSYKQDQAPRYHGRDVAVRRAQLADCPVLLGSATPSLESWYNATVRKTYQLHTLRDRVAGATLPKVTVVDFVEQQRHKRDKRIHLIGPVLEDAIRWTLAREAQVLVLLNRRGYANYIMCPDPHCGWLMKCDHCDVTMVYHRAEAGQVISGGGYVQCHHCLAEQKMPKACPMCANKAVAFGLGTQRVEEELRNMFPEYLNDHTMQRVDSDAMHGVRTFHSLLERFGAGEIRLLVGTQMIAKGLDYPGVRLVGVINADTSINLPDFRAAERTFQLISQVSGRSGRGAQAGRVVVQSFNPETPAVQLAAQHDYETFARIEMKQREQSGLPPWTRLVRIVVRDGDYDRSITHARELKQRLEPIIASIDSRAFTLRGPHSAPISRLADKYRQQIEILAPNAGMMQRLLTEARNAGLMHDSAAIAVDVDPLALL